MWFFLDHAFYGSDWFTAFITVCCFTSDMYVHDIAYVCTWYSICTLHTHIATIIYVLILQRTYYCAHCILWTVIEFPSDVTACLGEEARFTCLVIFTSETPSGANWIQNSETGETNVRSLPAHMLFDNSSSNSSLPAIVNNTLLITNVSAPGINSGDRYLCEQDGERSDSATLTIVGELCCHMHPHFNLHT